MKTNDQRFWRGCTIVITTARRYSTKSELSVRCAS